MQANESRPRRHQTGPSCGKFGVQAQEIHLSPTVTNCVEILQAGMSKKIEVRGVKRPDNVAREVAERTEVASGSDLKSLCKEASFQLFTACRARFFQWKQAATVDDSFSKHWKI